MLLVAPDLAVLDRVAFPGPDPDRSYGRLFPDDDRWYHLARPTGDAPAMEAGRWSDHDTRRRGSNHGFRLELGGTARAGEILSVDLRGGRADSTALWMLSAGNEDLDAGSLGPLLVDPLAMIVFGVALDAQGAEHLEGRRPATASDARFFIQALDRDFSNAVGVWVE